MCSKQTTFRFLIENLKREEQDFEFYPTTNEIIKELYFDIKKTYNRSVSSISVLDIGAGDGNVLDSLENLKDKDDLFNSIKKYAIEKSSILIQKMSQDIIICGTDFNQQSLIDKKIDVIFSNPPYSEYQKWVFKILEESNSEYIYLLIPIRWEENEKIKNLLKERRIKYEILGKYSFQNNAKRQARAIVHLIKFSKRFSQDAFDFWFHKNYFVEIKKEIVENNQVKNPSFKTKQDQIKNEIINREKIVPELVKLYQRDKEKVLNNYKKIADLDNALLEELGVSVQNLKEALKIKIAGLKQKYWQVTFDNLEDLLFRLTCSKRKLLLDSLLSNTNIDFTESNIYAALIQVIKNCNDFFDQQLKDYYYSIADSKNIKLYKSNKHFIQDGWRYSKKELSHFSLDYRIIKRTGDNFGESFRTYIENGLGQCALDFLKDSFTIGKTLGFDVNHSDIYSYQYEPGKKYKFNYVSKNKELKPFMDITFYRTGTAHILFCKEFIKKLNIEASRLFGWIKKDEDISEEIDDISLEEVKIMQNSLLKFSISNLPLLAA